MSEIQPQTNFPVGTIVWHAFSIFVPDDFYEPPGWNLVYQFHGWPDKLGTCDEWRTPVLSINIKKNHWKVWRSYNSQKCGHGQQEGVFEELAPVKKAVGPIL